MMRNIMKTLVFFSSYGLAYGAVPAAANSSKLPPAPAATIATAPFADAADDSAYLRRLKNQARAEQNTFAVLAYRPSYVLPIYYTSAIQPNKKIDSRAVTEIETKFQFSFQIPVLRNIANTHTDLHVAYTQTSFWQSYQPDPFFRDSNYEPAIFLIRPLTKWANLSVGVVHQSNGFGKEKERSWNRVYLESVFFKGPWALDVQVWKPVKVKLPFVDPTKLNKDTQPKGPYAKYLGYGQVTFSYKLHKNVVSIMLRNQPESAFKRGAIGISWSYPLNKHIRLYVESFNGYGRSLANYGDKSNSLGVGIAASDWI